MTTDTTRTDAARFEALRGAAIRQEQWLNERYKALSEADERAEIAEAEVERLLTTLKFLRDECDLDRRTFRRVSEAINQTYQ